MLAAGAGERPNRERKLAAGPKRHAGNSCAEPTRDSSWSLRVSSTVLSRAADWELRDWGGSLARGESPAAKPRWVLSLRGLIAFRLNGSTAQRLNGSTAQRKEAILMADNEPRFTAEEIALAIQGKST